GRQRRSPAGAFPSHRHRRRQLAGRRACSDRTRRLTEVVMPATRKDKAGRPVIAVTGMGVVTSLGVGKSDNWAKLTAGQSGIRRISRFPIDSLKTTIAGTVDEVYRDYMPPSEITERIALLAGE